MVACEEEEDEDEEEEEEEEEVESDPCGGQIEPGWVVGGAPVALVDDDAMEVK